MVDAVHTHAPTAQQPAERIQKRPRVEQHAADAYATPGVHHPLRHDEVDLWAAPRREEHVYGGVGAAVAQGGRGGAEGAGLLDLLATPQVREIAGKIAGELPRAQHPRIVLLQ